MLDEKPDKDKSSTDESHNKAEVDIHDKPKVRITTQPILAASPETMDVNSILAKVPRGSLGLFLINAGDLMLIDKAERITLGRQLEDAGTSISVDLASYEGAESGVSRRHAAILIYQDMYLLQDLGSTNGTWLNAVRLPSNSSHVLRNGDMIQLGQIRMQVVFHG